MNKKILRKNLYKNIFPAMIAFAFTGVYSIVDGIFVGKNTGSLGLAAIGIAYPLTMIIQALATGLGMAGSIHIGISIGEKNNEKEKKFFSATLLLTLVISILLTIILYILLPTILKLFKAENRIYLFAKEYADIMVLFSVFQFFSVALIPIVRNYKGVLSAMFAMILGFSTNVVLDWLFISKFQWGVKGAAIATIIGQFVSLFPLIYYLTQKMNLKEKIQLSFDTQIIKILLKTAISPFGLTIIPAIVLMIMNKATLIYGGSLALSTFTIIGYVITIAHLLIQGIGDGVQPLISFYYGAKEEKKLKYLSNTTYKISFITGIIVGILLYVNRNLIVFLFGVNKDISILFSDSLIYFIIEVLFISFVRVTISYLYAINRSKEAMFIIYSEPVILLITIFIFPFIWGLNGVWLSITITQLLLFVLSLKIS